MFDLTIAKQQRTIYLILFVCLIIQTIATIFARFEDNNRLSTFLYILGFLLSAAFIYFFMKTIREVLDFNFTLIIVLSLIMLFVPFISILVTALLDNRVFTAIKIEEEWKTDVIKPEFDGLTVWSIPCAVLPFVGLIMVIVALRRIARSNGRRSGMIVGLFSLAINLIFAYFYGWIVISLIAEFGFGVNIGGIPGL